MHLSATPEKLWFLDTLVHIHMPSAANADGINVMEHLTPYGSSPPLHIHHAEDEIFHVLEGEARFVLDGREIKVRAGQTLMAPKGSRHTFVVTSKTGARWLTITRGCFERMVRALSHPAERDELPVMAGPPTAERIQALEAACRDNDLEIVGPPLSLRTA